MTKVRLINDIITAEGQIADKGEIGWLLEYLIGLGDNSRRLVILGRKPRFGPKGHYEEDAPAIIRLRIEDVEQIENEALK